MSNPLLIYEFSVIDSTQDYAHKVILDNSVVSDQAFIAIEQTAGKGRENSCWNSPAGGNLYASVIIKLNDTDHFDLIGLVSCLALFNALNVFKKSMTKFSLVSIKWPNDLLINNNKFSGILVDMKRSSNWAVIGLGCNLVKNIDLSQFGYFSINSTPKELLQQWYSYFMKIRQYKKHVITETLNKNLAYKNKYIEINLRDKSKINGILLGISENGSLRLKTKLFGVKQIYTGDIISGSMNAFSN